MLREITLRHFQPHHNLSIPLRPGLNIICGESDRGKSAIIRALRFLTLHETATNLTTHGESDMFVRVVTTDNNIITRFKNSKEYGYGLNDLLKFLACSRDQPIPITTALNLTATNFQSQHDAHFLLCLTPGQVAREINKIVALEAIDKSLGWLKERIRSTNTLLESTKTDLADLADYLAQNKHIPRMGDMLTELKNEARNQAGFTVKRYGLAGLLQDLEVLEGTNRQKQAQEEACQKALVAGQALSATKATKQGLESILRESKTIAALPKLEAVGIILEGLLREGEKRLALKNLSSVLRDYDAAIFSEKNRSIALLEGFGAKLGHVPIKSVRLQEMLAELSAVQNEITQYDKAMADHEKLLAERATCSKCGRKY